MLGEVTRSAFTDRVVFMLCVKAQNHYFHENRHYFNDCNCQKVGKRFANDC